MVERTRTKQGLARELEKTTKKLEKLRDIEEKYKSLIKASPYAVTLSDLEGKITDLSKKTLRLYGYTRQEELLGKDAFKMIAPKDRKRAVQGLKETLEKGHTKNLVYTMIKKDGTHFIGEVDASLIKDSRGKPKAFIATTRDITTQQQAKFALERSEEKFKSLFTLGPQAVITVNMKGVITSCNPSTTRMTGYSQKYLVGKNALKLRSMVKTDIPRFTKILLALAKGRVPDPFYCRYFHKDGSMGWALVSLGLFDEEDGKKGVQAVVIDITEQKMIEKALRENEEKYRKIFESFTDVYYRTDQNGMVTDISPSVYKQAGWKPDEVIGHPVTNFYRDPSARDVFTQTLNKTGSVNDYELQLLAKDGRIIDVSVSSHLIYDDEGNQTGVEGVVRDISTRKEMEDALRESEEKFRTLVENSLQGIFIIQDFKVVYANEALAHITGYSIEELRSLPPKKLRGIVHPEDQGKVWGRMADRLAGKDVPPRYELKAIRKNGDTMWLEMVSSRIEFMGKPAVQGGVIDITDRQQADEQIKLSLKEKEVMLREIHHRVKNNMQIILSLLRIQSRSVKQRGTREIFKQSENRIRSMALIHEALYKSRDLANIDFADYIARMTTHLLSIYREDLGEIAIEQEVEGVFLDINRAIPCGLVISELVSNSLKHAFPDRKKGKLLIRMTQDKKGINRLTIKDNGIGLPEGLDYRETDTLGLQLVTDLVQQLKGTINVKKTKGTEFGIKF